MGLAKIAVVGVTHPKQFQHGFHGVKLNHWSGSDLVVIEVEVIHKISFLIPCSYAFRFASSDKVR